MIEIEYNEKKARRSSILKTSVDISLLNYVQKLITLPELTDEMWTKDLLSILENFLSSKRQCLLIACVDRHTSTLQLLHSIPSMAKSIDKIYSLCYFIRKNDSTEFITSIDEFLKQILFGFINGKSIQCLTALVSTLFGPLFMDNSTVQDIIKNDFASELNQFLATFYEIQYKHITSRTYLFIPKDGADKTIEELLKDKALVTRFESVMVKWYHQLKEVLLVQDRLMSNNEQSAGIHEEISCWQECLMDLHFIRKQLQRTELRNIIQVLVASKSAYVHQFLQAENQVQEFIEYVEDCLKFLKILDQPSSQLNDISLEKLKDV
ncbi:unnamed protein product, partial [Rotaria magnacalcarata]